MIFMNDLSAPPTVPISADSPYASMLGIRMQPGEFLDSKSQDPTDLLETKAVQSSLPTFVLPFNKKNIGNIFLPALHGGAIAGFLQQAMVCHLNHLCAADSATLPIRMIDFSIDYLRAGREATLYAQCEVQRKGRRLVSITANAWHNPGRKVAIARGQFLFSDAEHDEERGILFPVRT